MRLLKLMAGAMVAGMATSSHAYQTDFHFGMTYWLGLQVGLTAAESLELASGNEWKDTGMLDARPVVAYQICIKGDPTAFNLMREHHFRANEKNPAPPKARPVRPDTAFAAKELEELIREAQPNALNSLYYFGGALHGYQDTFSHLGASQVPPSCDANLVWTHPASRNGDTGSWPSYLSTNADLTFRWPKDCEIAAQNTYNHLRTFVSKVFPGRQRSPVWNSDLNRHVEDFCKAETKSAKVVWLAGHGVPQEQAIAQSTTLENGGAQYRYQFGRSLKLAGPTAIAGVDAKAVETRKRDQDMELLAKKIDMTKATPEERAVLERYLHALVTGTAASLPERLAQPFGRTGLVPADDMSLRMTQRLRFVDRGLAARDPMPLADLAAPNADIGTVPEAQAVNWRAMFVPPLGQSVEQPYILGSSAEGFVAFALLRHAPYEVLRITISRKDKRPTIAAVEVLALH